jgi:hypothetical protein
MSRKKTVTLSFPEANKDVRFTPAKVFFKGAHFLKVPCSRNFLGIRQFVTRPKSSRLRTKACGKTPKSRKNLPFSKINKQRENNRETSWTVHATNTIGKPECCSGF